MLCDICIEGNLEEKGYVNLEGHTICNPCLVKAIVFYCKNHKDKPSQDKPSKDKELSESVKEAWKEDNVRGWWG